MKKFLIGLGIVLLLFAVVGAFFWFRNQTSNGVSLEIIIPEDVQTGVPFNLEVAVTNQSPDPVLRGEISLNLPEEVILANQSTRSLTTHPVEDVAPGQTVRKVFGVVAVGGENSIKTIKIGFSYETGSLQSRFEVKAEENLVVTSPGIFVDIVAPTKILSGEEFQAKLVYRNESQIPFNNVELELLAPSTFAINESSEPYKQEGSEGGYQWSLGELTPGSEGEIILTGAMVGQEAASSDLTLRARVKKSTQENYVVSEKRATFVISPAPLSLIIGIANKQSDYVAKPGDVLQYVLRYKNNTDIALQDVVIRVSPDGEMFDLASIKTNGFLSSSDDAITWNASRDGALRSIAPGQEGQVQFQINVLKNYPIVTANSKNFTLDVGGAIESPTVPRFLAVSRVFSVAKISTKIGGAIDFSSTGFYRDAAAGIINSGSVPPKVGQPTQYTIHWQLENKTTDMQDIVLRAFLGSNVRYTGTYKTNNQTIPIYNDRTQELTWRINKLSATQGSLGDPVELIFQVELTPSIGQVGSLVTLVQEAQLSAKDLFTGQTFTANHNLMSTQMQDDKTLTGNQAVTN